MSWDDDDADWESEATSFAIPGAGAAAAPPSAPSPADFADEQDTVEEEAVQVPGSQPKKFDPKAATKAKKSSKQMQKERERRLAEEAELAKNAKPMTIEEKMAEKMRLQKLVEEADNRLAEELFAKKADGVVDVDSISATLSTVRLGDSKDFTMFATAIGKRLELESKPLETRDFFKELIRMGTKDLTGDDLVEINSVIMVIKNEKVKSKLGKKKKKKGKSIAMSRDMFDDHTAGAGNGDYFDDGDFM